MIGKMFSQLRLVVLTVSMLLIQLVAKSQIEVSVPFDDGFVGLIGQNTQQATNIQRFSTLTVARAFFVQSTASGSFEFSQGNDIGGTLRLQLSNGNKINIPGALVWRINSGNTNNVFGFVANSGVSLNLNSYGGPNYAISGGTAAGKSNFGFKLNTSTYTLQATSGSETGNAASGQTALNDLNAYLASLPRVLAPAPVNFALNTANQNPGDFSLTGFNSSDILLCAVGFVNPPAGTTFNFSVNTGLTLSTGYSSWTGLTRVSFTGTQADINAALASLTVSTGTTAGNINLSVSGTVNTAGYYFNPTNGHYYKPVSTGAYYPDAKTNAHATSFKGQEGYLITLTSASEENFVIANVPQNNIWFAATDRVTDGTWVIDDGPELGTVMKTQNGPTAGNIAGVYNNWCTGEPNGANHSEDYPVAKWNGASCWNDLNPNYLNPYIIEYGTWSNPDDQAFTDFYSASTSYTAICTSANTPVAPTVVSEGSRNGSGTVQLVVSAPAGTTVDWYAASSGGNILSGGTGVTTFTTPIISTSTIFYAQTRNSTSGCLSTTRTALTANVSTISSFTPTTAKSGETITITGSDFLGTTSVKIGGVEARSFTIVSATQITAIVPANATINTSVSVTNPDATNTAPGFTFSCASNALHFDGVDDFVQIGAQLPLTSSGNFTIEAWVRPTLIDNQYHGFFGMYSSTRAPSMWVGPNGSLHTDSYGGTTRFDMLIDNFFTLNKWTHVAWVKSGTTYTVYKNGVQVATRTAPASVELPVGNFWIGKVDNFFGGAIDEVRVWNTAKTAQEITANLGLEYNGNETGLAAYYNFNQGTASGTNTSIATLNNLTTGVNLNGTLTNMARTSTTSNFVTGVGPVILTQPAATLSLCNSVTSGNTLTVSAVGQRLTYQWYSNTTNSNTGGTAINGATSATFTAPSSTAATYYYYVIVSSACNGVTEKSTVSTVTVAPAVGGTATVSNRTVCNGSTSEIITFRPPTTAGYQWMTLNSVSANSASGVGQNGITVAITHSAGGMVANAGMYSPSTFPAEYSVPSTGTQIRNDNSGIFTATFSQPVRDPLVAFASVGNPNTPVPVIVSAPFTPIWTNTATAGWNTTYNLPNNTFTGNEGFNIIRIDGLVSSVSFNYTVAEVYSTIAFGFVDQNTTYSWTNDNPSIGLAASGTGNLPAFTAVNNGTTPVTANITVTPTSASGCSGTPQTFTITVNPTPRITYPNTSYNLERNSSISSITPVISGGATSPYSISPALPGGLLFNVNTGAITGTPLVFSPDATTYTITGAVTGCGSATSTLTIAVVDPTCSLFAAGDFQTNNNATYANNIYTLTPNQGAQNGSAWNKKRLFLDQNFEISARVYLGNSDAGADGIAFVLQNQSLNAGSSGGGLGYAGITPSFAVEFDTYNNGSHEPVQDHLAIIANGNAAGVHNTYSTPFEVQMEDGQWHNVRFIWDAASKNFQVWYDGTRRHNITVDLKANVFNGAPYVYWGFTGATGGATNLQQVQFNTYCYVQQVGVTALAGTNNTNAALSFCEGATVRLQASASTSYQWFKNGTAITGETGRELVVSTSGAYTVQAVTNQNTTLSEVVNVNVTLLPVITYASNYSFERTMAIANTAPTSTGGTVASYAITPALPTGLTFNTTNGTISGTPSVVSASATYTVTGTTATGCVGTTTFTLDVFNAVPPSALSYAPSSQTVRQGTAITNMVPSASGGVVASYSISPALPAGLSFNTTTGIISGTLTIQQTGTVVYTITATNSGGSTTATVTLVYNTAPTDITLSSTSVAENAASGTAVGTLGATDADAGDTHTYTLVSGTGDTDNASFAITGSTLSTAAVFDFETKSSYSVRVQVTDAGGLSFEKVITISVTDVNEAPTALAISNTSVLENAASGTAVGTLAGTDIDAGDTHTYTLVSGTGDTDNASFATTGSTLSTAAVFNFEAKSSYSVRVRVTDAGGLSFERAFTISVTDVNEAPTLTAITDRRVYNVSTSQVVNLAGITAGPETAQSTTTTVSTDKPATFSSISVVGTQIQFTLASGIVTPQDVVVTVRVKDNGGVANGGVDTLVRTFKLGIDPMPVASATPNLITLGATSQLSAAGANAVNYTWVAVGGSGIVGSGATINVRPKGTTTYAVVVTNSFGYQATVPVLLTVIVDYKLVPNNLVTPNGDGVNDKWVIPNIDMYPDNEVMVYDKAGRAVFAKRGYNNEWDGTVNGKLLKEDAYFYVIKFNKDGALPIRGYVSIVR
jgi:gliding motility-associated-like protein